MSTDWIKHKREHWPEGSLERHLALNYPGCKTLVEAFHKATKELIELRELKTKLKEAEIKPLQTEEEPW